MKDSKVLPTQVQNDEFFYPLVMIDEEMIGEGYIQLKPVFTELEKHGYVARILNKFFHTFDNSFL